MHYPSNKTLLRSGAVVILCMAIVWVAYLLFGRYLLESVYKSESTGWLSQFMAHREITPLESYYRRGDELMLLISFSILVVLTIGSVVTFVVRQPAGAFLAFCSLSLTWLVFFTAFEVFPSLIVRFGLDRIDYYAWNSCCIPDTTLLFRYRPLMDQMIPFKGYLYSPVYGVDVPQMTMHLTTDKDGFIHNNDAPEAPDIAIIGDSFIGDALTESDTFGRRLEAISGKRVANLGVAGYGPFQYLEVLKKYALPLKPEYAFFTFYAGNDIEDLRAYRKWSKTGGYHVTYLMAQSFPRRYLAATVGIGRFLAHFVSGTDAMILSELSHSYRPPTRVHPDIAVVQLANNSYKMLLTSENKEPSIAGLVASQEWQDLERIVAEFKSLCLSNGITPIIIYIPTATAIYAEHSTDESGENWLALRDIQVMRKTVAETAVAALAQKLAVEFIDLDVPFETAAINGELLYYTFDTHWNPRGRAVAAQYVAEKLKTLTKAGEKEPPTN